MHKSQMQRGLERLFSKGQKSVFPYAANAPAWQVRKLQKKELIFPFSSLLNVQVLFKKKSDSDEAEKLSGAHLSHHQLQDILH